DYIYSCVLCLSNVSYLHTIFTLLPYTTLFRSTHLRYLDNRILPAFQYFRLDQVKPIHIIDFLDNLGEKGMRLDKYKDKKKQEENKNKRLAPSTIFYHYRILNNIFNFAVEIQFLKESPLEGVKKPTVDYKESRVYDVEEASKLLKCLESETDVLHWQIII